MVILKLITVFALFWLTDAQCIDGDSQIGDLCYSFSNSPLNYTDARNYCHSKNHNLGIVHNLQQNNFLAGIVRNRLSSNYGQFWIGLSRPALNASFVWDDGTPNGWTNFDSLATDNLYVAENTMNGKWRTLNGKQPLDFVCSYKMNSATTAAKPKPSVTCLFMVDMQSSGIDQAAITTYQSYFNFAQLVAWKLNDASDFTGYLDYFGYVAGLNDHTRYTAFPYTDFKNIAFPIDGTADDIDMDLTEVDGSLKIATWVRPTTHQTCLIFFSAAPEALYGGTTIKTTYDSFTTVLGVLVGGATSIPGLANPIAATSLDANAAEAVVQKLLELLP